MELGLYLLEHGKVLDDLLGKGISSAGEVCEDREEAGRAVGGFGRLLQPVGGETTGEAARIVVGGADSRAALPCRGSCACGGRHGSAVGAQADCAVKGELPQTRSAPSKLKQVDWTGVDDVKCGCISSDVTKLVGVSSKLPEFRELGSERRGAPHYLLHSAAKSPDERQSVTGSRLVRLGRRPLAVPYDAIPTTTPCYEDASSFISVLAMSIGTVFHGTLLSNS